jgi:co-chaperonin GroES (HSP10)
MKPINDNVFIERLPQEKEHLGMHVAEKACIKNYNGVVRYSEDDKIVGKLVHVPHYGVFDVELDGTEYAMTKGRNLFAIRESTEYHPINGYVKVRKCVNDHVRDEDGEVALYMTENNIEKTYWVEVLEVADDCKHMNSTHVGLFCIAPEDSEKLARIGYSKDFCLHEDEIKFLTTGE